MNLAKVSDPGDYLPVEILELIFLFCLPSKPIPPSVGFEWYPVNDRTAPLLLCQISRRWRAIALGCPSLWAFLAVNCSSWTLRPKFPLIRIWIDRSKDHPFSFTINSPLRLGWNMTPLEEIIPLFLAEFARWHDVVIRLPKIPGAPSIHLPRGVTTAPLLRRLKIEVGGGQIPAFTEEIFRGLPSLSVLSWKVPDTRGLLLLNNINWDQLTNLDLNCKLSVENCLFVLHRSAMLRDCHLETVCVDEVISSDHLSIKSLIHLRSLHIDATINPIAVLQAITLPALDSLTISATASEARFTCSTSPTLLNLLRRSASPLRYLTLANARISQGILLEIIEMAQNLISLIIHDNVEDSFGSSLSDRIIHALAKRDDGTFACPGLKTLRLTGKVNCPSDLVVEMVEQRWGDEAVKNQVASLGSIHLEFREPSQDDIEVMRRLKSEGLQVRVLVKSERVI